MSSVIDKKDVAASRDSVELIFIFSITGFPRAFSLEMGYSIPRFNFVGLIACLT